MVYYWLFIDPRPIFLPSDGSQFLAFVVLLKTQARPLWYCLKPWPILDP
jgi:hypothetical protein